MRARETERERELLLGWWCVYLGLIPDLHHFSADSSIPLSLRPRRLFTNLPQTDSPCVPASNLSSPPFLPSLISLSSSPFLFPFLFHFSFLSISFLPSLLYVYYPSLISLYFFPSFPFFLSFPFSCHPLFRQTIKSFINLKTALLCRLRQSGVYSQYFACWAPAGLLQQLRQHCKTTFNRPYSVFPNNCFEAAVEALPDLAGSRRVETRSQSRPRCALAVSPRFK